MTIDVLILIALTEEADGLRKENFYSLSPERDLETFKYQEFSFVDCHKVRRSGRLVCAGEVGQRSRDAASIFYNDCRPQLVINVGISGRVKDARVGDIVVPTYVNAPGHRSAIEDDEVGGYHEIPGGKPFNVSSRALSIMKSADFRRGLALPSVTEQARMENLELTAGDRQSIERWIGEGLIASKPVVVDGPFAAGQPVVKSTNYKREVLGHVDRNIIALDMESAFIAAALHNFSDPPAFFAIRSISDPANAEKKKFDAIGDGLIRRWAMSNIRITLRAILEKSEIFPGDTNNLSKALLSAGPNDDYLSDYPGQRLLDRGDLSAFNDRFSNIRVRGQPQATFSEVVGHIEARGRGGRTLIQGRGGAGKSALLKKVQMEISKSNLVDTAFINVRKLLDPRQEYTVGELVREKLSVIIENRNRAAIVFLDELYGNSEEVLIINEIEDLLSGRDPAFVFAFGQDHHELLSLKDDIDNPPHVYDRKYDLEIDVKAIAIHESEKALRVVGGIIQTSLDEEKPDPSEVLSRLKAMGFLYVNHFIISLYLDNWQRKSFGSLTSTHFILRAMDILYNDLYPRVPEKFNDLCVEALRAFCRGLARAGVPKPRSSIAERYQTSFAHFPKIVQTNLIANAVIHVLRLFNRQGDDVFSAVGLDPDVFFGLVFTSDVNGSVKELMRDKKVEEDVISAANKILNRADDKGLSYAIYLFGRTRSPRGLEISESAMAKVAPQFNRLTEGHDTEEKEVREKFWRLARRSWHISRAMKNDRTATDQYIDYVLTDPYEDELNRSFHLEYYGDYRGTGITVELDLKDSGEHWGRTKDILFRRIEKILIDGKLDEYDRICLLTYFSIVRNRHETNKLRADERADSIGILDSILQRELQLRPELIGFLSMVKNALRLERYDKIDALVELFKFKGMPRFGWSSRRMFPRGAIMETVASHTWGAMFLAETLADYVMPDITDAQRYHLVRILLHHDLAESDIGDFDPRDGIAKGREPGAIERIASLATYEGLSRIKHIRPLFDEFEHGTSGVVSLARNFDKLDAIFQGYIYAEKFPDRLNRDVFFSYYLQQVKNDKLLQIAEEVVRRANLVEITKQSRSKLGKRERRSK